MNSPFVDSFPIADAFVDSIRKTQTGPSAIWRLFGPPSAGKSATLVQIAKKLREEANKIPVIVSPPTGHLDSGLVAFVEIGSAIDEEGGGQFKELLEKKIPWNSKLLSLKDAINQQKDRFVLLCDEPMEWSTTNPDEEHFAKRTKELIQLIFDGIECPRLITGDMESWRTPILQRSLGMETKPNWLNEVAKDWGAMSQYAQSLAKLLGQDLAQRSGLEIRLLVGLFALLSESDFLAWHRLPTSRRELSRKLAATLLETDGFKEVPKMWGSIGLVRRSFPESLLRTLGIDDLKPKARDLIKFCLLYEEDGKFKLHETLQADARENTWLSSRATLEVRGKLVTFYQSEFNKEPVGNFGHRDKLNANMEAFFHAVESGDEDLVQGLAPYFSEQLDLLGKTLSLSKKYRSAYETFESSYKWDGDNDYAHHYFAFNLDILGEQPLEVENHYKAALRINSKNPRWHSHWIYFLISRGRIADAKKAWSIALDSLRLPRADATPDLYDILHSSITGILMHRGQFEFADQILKSIPSSVRAKNSYLKFLDAKLSSLMGATKYGAFIPSIYLKKNWWEPGPFKLKTGDSKKGQLVVWIAARVDAVSKDVLHLRVAEVRRTRDGKNCEPEYLSVDLSSQDFDEWEPDRPARTLSRGDFLEIGCYQTQPSQKKKAAASYSVRVHPAEHKATADRQNINLFPNPARYLKQITS